MNSRFGEIIILLVCRDDGVVGLTSKEFGNIVDLGTDATKWVSVVRRRREKYAVKGPLGQLPYKIGMTDFCEKILGV
jgi:hypothetical protein